MNNGSSTKTHTYATTRFNAGQILPDAPEGEWEATVVRGKSTIKPTQKGSYPMVTFQVRLDRAESESNESFQGTTLPLRIIFFSDDSKSRGGNRMTKIRLRDLSEQTGVDLGIIPQDLPDPDNDLRAFVDAVEGKNLTVWTTHKKNNDTGETMVEVNLRKPGSFQGAATISRDDDE